MKLQPLRNAPLVLDTGDSDDAVAMSRTVRLAGVAVLAAVALIALLAGRSPAPQPPPAGAHGHREAANGPAAHAIAALAPPSWSGRVQTFRFFSPALRHEGAADVYLPAGYARGAAHGRRYPVMYLLHGSPGDAGKMFTAGGAPRVASALIRAHRIAPLILVAPHGRYGRRNATEWANGFYGPYESYIRDVVHATDATFATIPDRAHRVLAGDSEGGFGATNVALHNLALFGGFQSWSGYFTAPAQGTFAGASATTLAANSALDYAPALAPQIHRLGLHAYLYEGAQDRNGPMGMPAFAAELGAAGANVGSAVYPGGHSWRLWRAQMPHMLELASAWMSAARAPRA